MKKLLYLLIVLSCTMFTSCTDDDSQPTNDPTEENQQTELIITPSTNTTSVGEQITFEVTDAEGNIVTNATIYINDEPIQGNSFTSSSQGSFLVYAMVDNTMSNTTTISFHENGEFILEWSDPVIGQETILTTYYNGVEVTSESTFLINNQEIEDNTFMVYGPGSYQITVIYMDTTMANAAFLVE